MQFGNIFLGHAQAHAPVHFNMPGVLLKTFFLEWLYFFLKLRNYWDINFYGSYIIIFLTHFVASLHNVVSKNLFNFELSSVICMTVMIYLFRVISDALISTIFTVKKKRKKKHLSSYIFIFHIMIAINFPFREFLYNLFTPVQDTICFTFKSLVCLNSIIFFSCLI